MFRTLAYIVTVFWLLSLIFLAFTYQTIDGSVGRYIMGMATISFLGLAILETNRRRVV